MDPPAVESRASARAGREDEGEGEGIGAETAGKHPAVDADGFSEAAVPGVSLDGLVPEEERRGGGLGEGLGEDSLGGRQAVGEEIGVGEASKEEGVFGVPGGFEDSSVEFGEKR